MKQQIDKWPSHIIRLTYDLPTSKVCLNHHIWGILENSWEWWIAGPESGKLTHQELPTLKSLHDLICFDFHYILCNSSKMWFLGGWMYFPLKLKNHNKTILEWAKALDIPVPETDVQKANEHPGKGVQHYQPSGNCRSMWQWVSPQLL